MPPEPKELEDLAEDGERLYEHHRTVVDGGQSMLRIDKYLHGRMDCSRSRIQNAAKAGCLLVNDKPVKSNYRVRPHDVIKIVLPKPLRNYEIIPENMPLNIVFEDEHIIVLNKAAGMVVHPGNGNFSGTLVHGLAYHFKNLPIKGQGIEAERRPGLVHRIDKNTTGLMVVAKTDDALTHLAKQFFDHTVERRYLALAWGDLENPEGTITGHIGRNPRNRTVMYVFPEGEEGKHAITHYRVIKRYGYVSLVECQLETGRTHQIRVHFQHIGHPLFNDASYGGDRIVKGTVYTKYKQFAENCFKLLPRHALHAKILGFEHPATGEQMHFDSDLPNDMQAVIDKWERYMGGKVK